MSLYVFSDKTLESVHSSNLSTRGILERDLQSALKKDFSAIDENVLIIAEEFGNWNQTHKRIDLLGIDRDGNIVVVELKRNEDKKMLAQALQYSAMIEKLTFEESVLIYEKYLRKEGQAGDAKQDLLHHIELSEGDAIIPFGKMVRIILIAEEFPNVLKTTAFYLRDKGIDIMCYQLQTFKPLNSSNMSFSLILIEQVVPLPSKDKIIVFPKIVENKGKEEASKRDYTRYDFDDATKLAKRNLARMVILKYVQLNPNISIEQLSQVFKIEGLGVRLFQEKTPELEQSIRFFKDEIQLGGKIYLLSNQWSKDRIEQLKNCVQGLSVAFKFNESKGDSEEE